MPDTSCPLDVPKLLVIIAKAILCKLGDLASSHTAIACKASNRSTIPLQLRLLQHRQKFIVIIRQVSELPYGCLKDTRFFFSFQQPYEIGLHERKDRWLPATHSGARTANAMYESRTTKLDQVANSSKCQRVQSEVDVIRRILT